MWSQSSTLVRMNLNQGDRVMVVRDGAKPEALSGSGVLWGVTPFGAAEPTSAVVDLDAGPRVWVSLDLVRVIG